MKSAGFLSRFWRPLWVVWDTECGFCAHSVRLLKLLDWFGRCHYIGQQEATAHDAIRRPPIEDALWVLEQAQPQARGWYGFAGFRRLAWALPLGWGFLPLLYLPPIPWLGRHVYRWIATHRRDIMKHLP